MDSSVKQECQSYSLSIEHDEPPPPKRRPRHRLSCAECRRLKLKCDRVWPCGSCTKRGCARICPEGTLQAKVRSKDTSVLLAKIAELENALREKDQRILAAAAHHHHPHCQPDQAQLVESADYMPAHTAAYPNNPPTTGQDPSLLSLIDGIGTLNVSGDGRSRYLGLSASSAYLDEDCSDSDSVSSTPGTSEDPDDPSGSQPPVFSTLFTAGAGRRFDTKHLKSFLPEKLGAERLGNAYLNFVSHLHGLLNQSELKDLMEEIYGDQADAICLTRLALLYAIFALGVLFDPGLQGSHADARKWYEACETCLMSTDFLTNPTLSAVQTIHMMSTYMLNTRIDAAETFWPILGIAMRLCQSMGLHRADGSNWGLQSSELEQRRRTFHEILSLDRLQSLVLGRPYALSDKHYDTLIPSRSKTNANDDDDEGWPAEFQIYKWRFSTCIGRVVDDVFSVAAPSLAVINRLDQEIRVFDAGLPNSLKSRIVPTLSLGPSWSDLPASEPSYQPDGSLSVQRLMQQHCMTVLENQTLLFLHRRAFALALSESPSEPLQSSFATSVISVIVESSRNLITILKAAQTAYPEIANKWWHPFFHAYSGATCVATLLIKSPGCMLAKHAWSTLSAALLVFENAANHGPLCRELLTRLNRLHKHALLTFNAFSSGNPLPKPRRLSNLTSSHRALRPLSLSSQEDGSTPLAHCLESYRAMSQADSPVNDFPCDLGASTRLIRKSRGHSMSNSSVASNGVPSASSSSRSRGTSFGSASPNNPSNNLGNNPSLTQRAINSLGANTGSCHNNGPNGTLAGSFNTRSWALVSTPDDFDDEESTALNNPPYWDNLSVEPANEGFSPIFSSQPGYFSGFSEQFHPPMALPTNELGPVSNAYGPIYGAGPFESPSLQPLPPPATNSPPVLSLSNQSRSTSLNHSGMGAQDGNKNNGPASTNETTLTSPTSTQFDLLDTFLTWQGYDQ
ncbi:hypothetical protein CROQUDRAFT_40225 [Cronartium quercuum f. sp. fusiforme G11]|uniref:Zn(2)-C6 fungal-type domain-containing protein n=1 Tax=Cronartium quercuum f. sp. fusiforme G11 TaxID=708437 RepID=A0A9P6TE67_9BASI|nr:hypothetical protein CROQUDRAFT_40225 [Cronartium quercuum f. sp. fusiforme G11]